MSIPANAWGSVVGNALERGYGYTPYGENTRNICGLEVVLPNGDLVRTGNGAMSNSHSWQLFKYGYGPSWDQLFCQSNFGVVTTTVSPYATGRGTPRELQLSLKIVF